jgi:hypothetical protein
MAHSPGRFSAGSSVVSPGQWVVPLVELGPGGRGHVRSLPGYISRTPIPEAGQQIPEGTPEDPRPGRPGVFGVLCVVSGALYASSPLGQRGRWSGRSCGSSGSSSSSGLSGSSGSGRLSRSGSSGRLSRSVKAGGESRAGPCCSVLRGRARVSAGAGPPGRCGPAPASPWAPSSRPCPSAGGGGSWGTCRGPRRGCAASSWGAGTW